jgi:hypothetical protein
MEKLTTPISDEPLSEVRAVRFTPTEAAVLDEWARELNPGCFRGVRKGHSNVGRTLFSIVDALTAAGVLQMTPQGVKEFLSYLRGLCLQDGAALKFPPRTVSVLEEAGQLRLAVGGDVPPKCASLTGTNRQPLRFSATKDRTAKESWFTSGVQFRTLLAGRVA